jgi:NTP pyrophosphatase (non-canonical NTP hydrolase)
MTKDILAYIRSLSVKDKKTLSQKALKTCEEVGELAKAILPFDSAHGTNHQMEKSRK